MLWVSWEAPHQLALRLQIFGEEVHYGSPVQLLSQWLHTCLGVRGAGSGVSLSLSEVFSLPAVAVAAHLGRVLGLGWEFLCAIETPGRPHMIQPGAEAGRRCGARRGLCRGASMVHLQGDTGCSSFLSWAPGRGEWCQPGRASALTSQHQRPGGKALITGKGTKAQALVAGEDSLGIGTPGVSGAWAGSIWGSAPAAPDGASHGGRCGG